jgi:hypothetical protein
MTNSGELYTEMEIDGDLSNTMGAETLAGRGLIPSGFDNAPRARTEACQSRFSIIVDRYLKVERNAILRKRAKLSTKSC